MSAILSRLTDLFAVPNDQVQGGAKRDIEFVNRSGDLGMRLSWEIAWAPWFQWFRFSPLVSMMTVELPDQILYARRCGQLEVELLRGAEVIGLTRWHRHHRGKLRMCPIGGKESLVEARTDYTGFFRGDLPSLGCSMDDEIFAYLYGYDHPQNSEERIPFLAGEGSPDFSLLAESEQYCAVLSAFMLLIMCDFRTANYSSG